ncbi:hypothetical protein AURDEDRAFT_145195 [Auricularia subglabra TFB-10046 SS5]|nr:hypothetical protein AURDEDRAFT_145195 [Auricularia subglabra TFB-10046 SS5]
MTNTTDLQGSSRFLNYLDLPDTYKPSPSTSPLAFLKQHLHQLPKHLAIYFASRVPARTRTTLPLVRNRRLNYVQSGAGSVALGWQNGRARWPLLWEQSGSTRDDIKPGELNGAEERAWANRHFMHGRGGELNKLGALLAEYEAEREAERTRQLRRDDAVRQSMMPQVAEEEEDSDEEVEEDDDPPVSEDPVETVEEHRLAFERRLQERFIYGLLDGFEYDDIDWDDKWDTIGDQDAEDRWFDEDDEDDAPMEIDRPTTPDY